MIPAVPSWLALGLLSAVFAALVAVFAKLGLQAVDATLATSLRAILMAMLLAVVGAVSGRFAGLGEVPDRAWVTIVQSGLAGAASWLCYCLAIQAGDAAPVAALDRLSIVFVVLLAAGFLGEALSPLRLLGAGLIVVGARCIAR